jgi:hypothetical protein
MSSSDSSFSSSFFAGVASFLVSAAAVGGADAATAAAIFDGSAKYSLIYQYKKLFKFMEKLANFLGFFECDFRLRGNSQQSFENVGNEMRCRSLCWIANSQRNGSNRCNSLHETGTKIVLGHIKHFGRVNRTSVIHLLII